MKRFYIDSLEQLKSSQALTLIATPETWANALDTCHITGETRDIAQALLSNNDKKSITLYRKVDGCDAPVRLSVIIIEPVKSRDMPKQNVFALQKMLKDEHLTGENAAIALFLNTENHVEYASVVAEIVKSSPVFTRKTEKEDVTERIAILCDIKDTHWSHAVCEILPEVARWVDTPTLEMTTEIFASEALAFAQKYGLKSQVIADTALLDKGFGGLWHVGKSGKTLPRLIVLEYAPSHSSQHIALVGKGLVYDTGGLCLKPRDHMATMKSDMGGAAAVLGAIGMASMLQLPCRITAILCVAENGIGPDALRPDDIIQLYSGLTVEINNTDAEGRLVLGDGVAYASKDLQPDYIIDAATLTGAQLMCTGKRHAGLLTPDAWLQDRIVEAGKTAGEPVYPLLYAPEILFSEFKSDVADMKNSCKDRLNAQSSCAGHFVEKHLNKDWQGKYAHIDIAGPAWNGERATGYGALLLAVIANSII
ncbi:MAG: leucyl aminopeptidase family protein [Proteobacteria bacterium]|nr:leucyl aminopeptidase family protein [Pseudomonadota bacterium]